MVARCAIDEEIRRPGGSGRATSVSPLSWIVHSSGQDCEDSIAVMQAPDVCVKMLCNPIDSWNVHNGDKFRGRQISWQAAPMKMQERIRRARRKAGLSQAGLADMVKVRRSAVSNWESANDVMPSMQNLVAVARACGVSIEWLGTGRGGMSTDPEALADIPTADAELVDAHEERELLAAYRNLPRRSQNLLMELAQALRSGKRASNAS